MGWGPSDGAGARAHGLARTSSFLSTLLGSSAESPADSTYKTQVNKRKTEFMNTGSGHTCGRNSVMSSSKGQLDGAWGFYNSVLTNDSPNEFVWQ